MSGNDDDKRIIVKWVRSLCGRSKIQRSTIKGLGFKRLNQSLILQDRPEIRGMIRRVIHLLEVKEYKL